MSTRRHNRMKLRSLLRRRSTVTLAIDDGPSTATPHLMAQLERGGHRAVLFMLGCNIAERRDVAIDAVRRGFAIGNHSYDHAAFSRITLEEARRQIAETERLIEAVYARAGVRRPGKWFRFPYLDTGGDAFEALQTLLGEFGFQRPPSVGLRLDEGDLGRLDWPTTVSTRDWALPPEAELRLTLREARAGDIIEFHDKPETVGGYVAALIEELDAATLRGVTPGAGFGFLR